MTRTGLSTGWIIFPALCRCCPRETVAQTKNRRPGYQTKPQTAILEEGKSNRLPPSLTLPLSNWLSVIDWHQIKNQRLAVAKSISELKGSPPLFWGMEYKPLKKESKKSITTYLSPVPKLIQSTRSSASFLIECKNLLMPAEHPAIDHPLFTNNATNLLIQVLVSTATS